MPYKRQLRRRVVWMASYYVPAEMLPTSVRKNKAKQRVYEACEDAGYPNSEKGAGQLESRRSGEIKSGKYVYQSTGEHTAETWLSEWTQQRSTRDKEMDRRRVENHFFPFRDFRNKKLSTFSPSDFKAWAKSGKELVADKKLSGKTFANVYGVVHTMFHEAVAHEKLSFNPCVLSAGDLPMRMAKRGRRYEDAESRAIVWNTALPADVRVLFCLLSFTGERVGEACGHIWSDWDRESPGLGSLLVERQYDGRPLKTSRDKERPRAVPVHPELAKALEWWHAEGWAALYGRSPRPGDPIIPNVFKRGHHSEKSVYHLGRDAFGEAGLTWKGHHACRHAFTTTVRRRGAPEIWVERITHNAGGSIVDHYTHTEWQPLCDVVSLLPWTTFGDTNGDGFDAPADNKSVSGAGEGIRTLDRDGKVAGNREKQGGNLGGGFPEGSASSEALAIPVATTEQRLFRALSWIQLRRAA